MKMIYISTSHAPDLLHLLLITHLITNNLCIIFIGEEFPQSATVIYKSTPFY